MHLVRPEINYRASQALLEFHRYFILFALSDLISEYMTKTVREENKNRRVFHATNHVKHYYETKTVFALNERFL